MVLNSNNFDDLPEKEQVYRLRKLVDAALEKFGFNQYQLTLLQHLVNTTFRLDCNQGRYLVQIHRAKTRTAVESELAWLEALAHETTVSVQMPQRSLCGEMMVLGKQVGVPGPYPVFSLGLMDRYFLKSIVRHITFIGLDSLWPNFTITPDTGHLRLNWIDPFTILLAY